MIDARTKNKTETNTCNCRLSLKFACKRTAYSKEHEDSFVQAVDFIKSTLKQKQEEELACSANTAFLPETPQQPNPVQP